MSRLGPWPEASSSSSEAAEGQTMKRSGRARAQEIAAASVSSTTTPRSRRARRLRYLTEKFESLLSKHTRPRQAHSATVRHTTENPSKYGRVAAKKRDVAGDVSWGRARGQRESKYFRSHPTRSPPLERPTEVTLPSYRWRAKCSFPPVWRNDPIHTPTSNAIGGTAGPCVALGGVAAGPFVAVPCTTEQWRHGRQDVRKEVGDDRG